MEKEWPSVSLSKQKVYENVLNKIKQYINEKQLQSGDRLPSERELAEQLGVGRSSIREALRAIELLGLIETKRGEGTFLREYRSFRTLELLSTFVLQEKNTIIDVSKVKVIIEKEATKLAFKQNRKQVLEQWRQLLSEQNSWNDENQYVFYQIIFEHIDNELLFKIWSLLRNFMNITNSADNHAILYRKLLYAFEMKQFDTIETIYQLEGSMDIKDERKNQ